MSDTLHADLAAALPAEALVLDLAGRVLWAEDASIYRLVPRAVVLPRSADEVAAALAVAARTRTPVCFRAGGTSLSGQAVTDGILIVVSRHLRGIAVAADGAAVTCQPGAVGAWVNAALAPHGRRIGPDPASIQAAEIGGIVANNASGMCCGVHENSYRTVTGLDLILADGTRIDTGAADADARLAAARPDLAAGLAALRDRVRGDAPLAQRIRTAFATKNTVGYSLNAFLDADTPAAILQKLVVGSEGTLAFIAAATFRTLPLPRHRATAWLVFPDIAAAGRAVAPLADAGCAAIELLDAASLHRVAAKLPAPPPPGEPAALLVECQDEDPWRLGDQVTAATAALADHRLLSEPSFSTDPALQARLWAVRKGLFPSVGAVRAAGTTVVIEDVTFPVARLAEGVTALRALFAAHGYADAVVFGHAKDGNLHFTLCPDLSRADERDRYAGFMAALVDLVLALGGHLKAEHGTGRNMAPFVVRQWGADAVAVMRAVKDLLDPLGILNPGVLLSDDPEAHLRHLKGWPAADPLVDRCIACGFCEPACPSRDHALSPRQRIGALRAIAGGGAEGAAVAAVWPRLGLDGCAADGQCATACPVGIDTGAAVRAGRAADRGPWARSIAGAMRRRFATVTAAGRLALAAAALLPGRRLPGRSIPLPPPAPPRPAAWPVAEPGAPTLLWVPSCVGRVLGPDDVGTALHRLAAAAGVGVVVVDRADRQCCGQPFASKGFPAEADAARRDLDAAVARTIAAHPGLALVPVIDAGTCAGVLAADGRVRDPATVAAEVLIPRLMARGRLGPGPATALHPTCSEQQHGWAGALSAALPGATTPVEAACCGMAGDRGWAEPGLSEAATAREAAAVRAAGATAGACTNAACAMALGAATGIPYRHPWVLLAGRLIG